MSDFSDPLFVGFWTPSMLIFDAYTMVCARFSGCEKVMIFLAFGLPKWGHNHQTERFLTSRKHDILCFFALCIYREVVFRLDESITFEERGRLWEAAIFLHFSIFFDSVLGGSRPHFLRFWSAPGASKCDPFLQKWCSRRGETPLREKPRFFIKNPPPPKNMEKLSQKSPKNHKMEPK